MSAASGTHIVDERSLLATPSELDLFSVPLTQVAVCSGHWRLVRCTNQLDSAGPWNFQLDTGGHYMLLSKNYLHLKIRIVRTDGGNVQNINQANDIVGPINKLASTFFKTVKLYIGSKLVSDSYDLYAYRSILETELNYNTEVKEAGHLKASLYDQDRPFNHLEDENNVAFNWRRHWFNNSRDVEIIAPLHIDLFNIQRVLPTHTKIRLDLYRNSDAFCLKQYNAAANANRSYRLEVRDMALYVRMLDVSKSAHLALESALLKTPAKYPLRLTKTVRISIPQNVDRSPQNTIFQGQIPRRLVLGMVTRDSYNGHAEQNPFRFQNFNVEEIIVTAGGITYPREPLRTNFQQGLYLRAYLQLLESIGMGAPSNQGCRLTTELFREGMALFAYDLTSDETSDGSYWDLTKSGSTYLDIRFGNQLAQAIEVIVYAEFDSLLRIDYQREPYLAHMI